MAPSLTLTIKEKLYFMTSTIEKEMHPIGMNTVNAILTPVLGFTIVALMGLSQLSEGCPGPTLDSIFQPPNPFIYCDPYLKNEKLRALVVPILLAASVVFTFAILILSIQFLKYAFDSFLSACGYIVQWFAKNGQLEFSCKKHAV